METERTLLMVNTNGELVWGNNDTFWFVTSMYETAILGVQFNVSF
jgi:hypothetical protein